MTDRLSLPPRHRRMVEALLREHVPEAEVWAYGSRVNGESHDGSDLDLVVRSPSLEPMGAEFLDLVGAFQESNIPILVQAHDWAGLPKSFHQEIERDYVVVQEGVASSRADRWRQVTLDDVCIKIGSGATPRGGRDVYLPDGLYTLIRSQNIYNDGFHRDGLAFIGEHHADELENVEVFERDVLLNITGDSVARVCQVAPDVLPARVNQHVAIIRPDSINLDADYLRYYLVSPEMQTMLLSWAGSGGTRNALTKGMIESLEVLLPPLPEQRAIAHVLGTLDDKIELNRRMNETLESMARAIFQDWFVDFGPTRAKMEGREPYLPPDVWSLFPDRLVDSELGAIPEGWGVRALGEVVELLRDQENPLSSPETVFSHFSIPAFDDGRMPKQEQGESIKSAKSRVPPGVILLSKLNPDIERVWLTDVESGERAVCSTEFLVLRPRQPFGTCFVYCLGRSPAFRQQLGSLVTGTSKSHQRAPAEAVLALPTILPSKPVTDKFERFTQAILGKTQMNQRESHTLVAQRDALLPRLVSGEVGVI